MNTSFTNTRIKQKIDSLDNWTNSTLILLSGEIAVVDMGNGKFRMKVGDGVSTFNDLPYVSGGTAVNVDSHSAVDEFSVIHISKDEYEQRVAANNGSILSNVLYIVSSDVIDARGERIANLGNPVDLSDAVNFGYAESHYLTEHQSLSGYYTKSETNQLSTEFRYGLATTSELTAYETKADHNSGINILSNAISSKVLVDGQYAENIQLKNVTIEEYAQLLKEGTALSNCIYKVSSENFEAFGNKIVNVADPEYDQDAATKHYVDTEIHKVDVSDQLTSFAKSTDLTAYARKSTTLAGYGITDAATPSYVDTQIQNIDIPGKIDRLSSNIIGDVTDLVGGNAQFYKLVTVELSAVSSPQYGDILSCSVENCAVTTININSTSKPVYISLPQSKLNIVRDFVIRIEVLTTTNPSVAFVPYDGEDIDFEAEDQDWLQIRPGVNIISFSETKRTNS